MQNDYSTCVLSDEISLRNRENDNMKFVIYILYNNEASFV
jgi:hypothetical protein